MKLDREDIEAIAVILLSPLAILEAAAIFILIGG